MSGRSNKILITGGLGNLGSWLTDYFSSDEKYDVTVLSKNDRVLSICNSFKKILCDITDYTALKRVIDDIEFDYVIHLASINETFLPEYANQALQINTLGTRNLLEACTAKKIKKFIYLSTFHVYGKNGGEIVESDIVLPANDYAITHHFAEEYVKMFSRRHGYPFIIFRLSNSYGCPKDINASKWYLLFNDLCKQAAEKKKIEIRTNGKALRDFISMKDACSVVEKVLENEQINNELFNLGSGQSTSIIEIANYIRLAYQEMYNETISIRKNDADMVVYPNTLHFNIGKLKKAIDFVPGFYFKEEAKKIFSFVNSNPKALQAAGK